MKKLLFLFFLMPLFTNAQDFHWHSTSFGISAGPELLGIQGNNRFRDFGFSNTTAGAAFAFGPRLQFPVSQRFAIRSSFLLAQRSFTVSDNFFFDDILFVGEPFIIGQPPFSSFIPFPTFKEVSISSFDTSLELVYMFPGELVNWYINAGPRYHMYLGRKIEDTFVQDPLSTPSVERESRVDLSNVNWSFQMGGGVAVKLNKSMNIFLEANSLFNLTDTEISPGNLARYRGLSLNTGINFLVP